MVLTWKVFCIPASEPICILNPLTANSCLWLCRADSRFPFCVGWPGRFLSPADRHGEQGRGVPVLPKGQKGHGAAGMGLRSSQRPSRAVCVQGLGHPAPGCGKPCSCSPCSHAFCGRPQSTLQSRLWHKPLFLLAPLPPASTAVCGTIQAAETSRLQALSASPRSYSC